MSVRVHEGIPEELVGFQQITGHIIFDLKMGEGFRRKARFVGDGHKTKPQSSITYSSVVSRDPIRIMLLVAALNNLDIQGADWREQAFCNKSLVYIYQKLLNNYSEMEQDKYIYIYM